MNQRPHFGARVGALVYCLVSFLMVGGLTVVAMPQDLRAQTVEIPAECSAYMTVQMTNCRVSHFMTCTNLEPGQYRVDRYDDEGLRTVTVYDTQMNPLVAFFAAEGLVLRQDPDSADRLSMDELIETGRDTYDSALILNDDQTFVDRGFDRLTDETVVIDGRELTVTEFNLHTTGPDGETFSHTTGHQYLDRELRFIFGGIFRDISGAGEPDVDTSPVDFVPPDENGFLSSTPQHNCGVSLVRFSRTNILSEAFQ